MISKPDTSTDTDKKLSSSNHSTPISHHPSPSSQNHLIHSNHPQTQTQTQLHLPIRLSPYPPQLAALDAEFKRKYHEILNDRNYLMPQSLVFEKAEDAEDRSIGPDRQRRREMLDKNFADRTPYVQLASRRLQAVLGTRNEHVFDLPSVSVGNNTAKLNLENLYDIPDGSIWGRRIGGGRFSKLMEANKSMGSCVELGDAEGKSDKGKRPEKRTSAHLESHHSVIPNVDKVTGAGLREFLISKGREYGERQRRCLSITMCDFTPEMRTHGYADKVLGHWEGASEKGQRVEVHEVELPSTSVNILTGEATTDTETWIWFLISRPVLGLSSEKSSRHLDDTSPSTSVMSSEWCESSFKRKSSSFNRVGDSPRAPPNFPYPIPISWIVFACPKAHVTCHPETTETIEDRNSSLHPAFPNPSNPLQGQPQNQKVRHLSDYDLSIFGIPIFEFSSPHLFDGHCIEFSSVNGMEGWDEKDVYLPYSKDRYELEREYAELSSKREQNEYGEDQGIDPPCPNHGDWWHKFYKEMYEDARSWKKIKHAMGRGKCRISVHWDESNDTAKATGTEDEDVKDADRLLRDIGLGITGAVAHARKKSRSSLGKEKIAVGKHRATRSETRRRSSLGLEVWLASGSDGPSEGFERAAAKGQKMRGNRKSAPVMRLGLL